ANDEERREAADVWIDNEGSPESTFAQVDAVWAARLAPYDAHLRSGTRSRRPERGSVVVDPDPAWAAEGRRLVAKLTDAWGDRAVRVDHIGSTSVPGLAAKDVIDLQVGVRILADADAHDVVADLLARGFVRSEGNAGDTPHGDHPASSWAKRFFGSMDPARIAHVHVREMGSPGWEFALLFRDWMRADGAARDAYAAEKRRILTHAPTTRAYVAAKEPWFDTAYASAQAWGRQTGWRST
ncbi:MAG: dephospho-CoA kinase, partial [Lapillicoccus sp.]